MNASTSTSSSVVVVDSELNRPAARFNIVGLDDLSGQALRYAAFGWHVLPVRPGAKEPLTEHGHKDATTDPGSIEAWWGRHPNANIGVATGPSGLFVVDVDCHRGDLDFDAWLAGREWPNTFTVRTGRGGLQFYFEQPATALGCTAGLLAPLIDTRGVGGYVVAPPSITDTRYLVLDDAPIVPPPDWVVAALSRRTPAPVERRAPQSGWVTAYGSAALDAECNKLAGTHTARNDTLNRVAFRMGQLIAANHLDVETVERRLITSARRASSLGDHPFTEQEITATIRSGIDAGMARPATNRAQPPPPATRPPRDTGGLTVQCRPLEEYTDPPPSFLWGNRLTVGGMTIIAGDGGVGKSFLTTNLAVGFAEGDGLPDQRAVDRGSTVIISYEDPGEVIFKRAAAMGYDRTTAPYGPVEAIYAPEAFRERDGVPVQLAPEHVDDLARFLGTKPNLRLVIVDPLMSFVGANVDTFKDQQVRAVLHRLTALADDLKIAVIVVAHTVKGTPDPARALDAIAGSAGIKNIARSALIAMRDPETGRNFLFHRKHNWTAPAPALEYSFTNGHFEWVGPADDGMLTTICTRSSASPIERCVKWLEELLVDGAARSTYVFEKGKAEGFAMNTIRAAQRSLGVRVYKEPRFQGAWFWELPDDM